jgi:hypothetical protein
MHSLSKRDSLEVREFFSTFNMIFLCINFLFKFFYLSKENTKACDRSMTSINQHRSILILDPILNPRSIIEAIEKNITENVYYNHAKLNLNFITATSMHCRKSKMFTGVINPYISSSKKSCSLAWHNGLAQLDPLRDCKAQRSTQGYLNTLKI